MFVTIDQRIYMTETVRRKESIMIVLRGKMCRLGVGHFEIWFLLKNPDPSNIVLHFSKFAASNHRGHTTEWRLY